MAGVAPRKVQSLFGDIVSEATPLFVDSDDGLQAPPGIEALAPPLPAPPAPMGVDTVARLAAAIGELRATGQRLEAEVATDALEIACLMARRILEAELKADGEALKSLVRSAVRRLGEVHKVTIHLCPADAESVRTAAGEAPLGGLGIAKVEIVADTNLTPGDCFVESDAATVDGRLGTRVEELRRVLANVMNATAEAKGERA
jgi:flagellar biosynthesis/type III secretory pathway protein FliH